jgi:hypothetical protein
MKKPHQNERERKPAACDDEATSNLTTPFNSIKTAVTVFRRATFLTLYYQIEVLQVVGE